MGTQPLQKTRNRGRLSARQQFLQVAVLEPMKLKLAAHQGLEQRQIRAGKQVEARIGTLAVTNLPGKLLQVLNARGRVVERREKLQVAPVRGAHQFCQSRQAVDGLFDRGDLHLPGAIPMFHPSVVPKNSDVVGRGLQTQHPAQLVIHLDRQAPHVVLDAGALNARVKIVADLAFVSGVQLAAQKGRDILGLDGMHSRSHQNLVEGLEIRRPLEDDVGGVLHLHQAPVVTLPEVNQHRTVLPGEAIQSAVQDIDAKMIGQLLRLTQILEVDKDVVHQLELQSRLLQLRRQQVVPIAVELEAKGRPGGNPQEAQTQVGIEEVEVVVEALAVRRAQGRLARLLVMPGLEACAWLQGREDVDQSRSCSALLQDLLHSVLFTEVPPPDEFHLQPRLLSQALGVKANFFAQGLDKLGVIEQPDVLGAQQALHRLGMADLRQCPGDDNPVEA